MGESLYNELLDLVKSYSAEITELKSEVAELKDSISSLTNIVSNLPQPTAPTV